MSRLILSAVCALVVLSSGAASAQQAHVGVEYQFPAGGGVTAIITVTGPPNCPFDLFMGQLAPAVPVPWVLQFMSGMLDANGRWQIAIPLLGSFNLPELHLAALVNWAGVPIPSPIIQTAVVVNPPVFVPAGACVRRGSMTYDKNSGTLTVKGKACPGDTVTIVFNWGNPITVPVAADGTFFLETHVTLNGFTAIRTTVNGAGFLGPIIHR
ncbi:MAG: hypothetical protein CMJ83_15165 [Planctomycetes bacterium]|nr:hypothetical protein [Planctomycetota bacterium]